MDAHEMKGIRQLSKEIGLKEKDMKELLTKNNILIDKHGLNPIAIQMGIALQLRVYVSGVYRNQVVYNPETINQILKGVFKPLQIIEEQPF